MRITICLIGVVIVAGLLLVPVPLKAHHAFSAAFDENKPLNLQGKVTKVELVNPHSWLWIDVTGPDGKVTNWGIERGPPVNLFRNGITKTSLQCLAGSRIILPRTKPSSKSGTRS